MEILLEEFFKTDFILDKYHDRKTFINEKSCQICGVTQSGKTKLVKSYLSTLKKRSYLYIDCSDSRIEIEALNKTLQNFCTKNKISTLVLDNYNPSIKIVNVSQLILISQKRFDFDFLETIWLYPLDYEEFLAYEHKFDSTALNHYLQLGGLTCMHKLQAEERVVYIQQKLKYHLLPIEFEVLKFIAKYNAQKISPYSIYERLKSHIKISKDKTYASYKELFEKKYFFEVEKFEQKKAVKKLYLCDIFLKTALSIDKHFGRLFENLIFLELYKKYQNIYYHDNIDFYLPNEDEVIFCKPFADERRLFKKLETIEAFLFSYNVKKVTVITMNKEGTLSHPLCKVEIIPFDIWALGD